MTTPVRRMFSLNLPQRAGTFLRVKVRPLPWLFAALLFAAVAANAESVNGHTYVAITTWARANGFGCRLADRGAEFVLTNRNSKLVFDQDSADSTVNGVSVRLSYPVAKGGLVSQLDLEKTIKPLVFSQRPSPRRIRTICLDPGHGGRDTGNRVGRIFARSEKTYTLALALELRRQLQQAGFNVVLTRDKDVYPELSDRPALANRRGADLFISLHFNTSPSDASSVQGPETYCITPVGAASSNDSEGVGAGHGACPANRFEDKSLLLAYQVQRSLVRGLGATDRSVRRARFEVLRTAEMPAILVEGGYMSHPTEGRKIFDAAYRKQMAAAIVRGVQNYQKSTAPATVAGTETNKLSR